MQVSVDIVEGQDVGRKRYVECQSSRRGSSRVDVSNNAMI